THISLLMQRTYQFRALPQFHNSHTEQASVLVLPCWMCCPMGWRFFQKSCYYTSTDSMSWNESKENCTGMGSHLVVIDTEAEQVKKTQYVRKDNYYIGLSAQKVGQWHWVDQTPFNVTAVFWRTGEPSNVEEEKCVVIHWKEKKHWNWNDFRCEVHSPRICEAAAITV
uniref:C-type lectin domain family 4 member D n=1 Tax=Apteryx owenii TaxID=8824 RepID=A0A8B9P6W9_APTOW